MQSLIKQLLTILGAGTVSSSSHAGGPQQNGPNFNNYAPNNNYPEPIYNGPNYGRAPIFNGPYDGPYNVPNNIYGEPSLQQQPWFYRSAWEKNDDPTTSTDAEVIEAAELLKSDRISKSSESDNVTIFKAPETTGSTVIFKD